MARLARFLFLAALITIPFSSALAQIQSTGSTTSTPIQGAGHDYIKMLGETVNPASGSLSVRIQLPTPKGRGATMPFSLAYDSNGVTFLAPDFNTGTST